MLIRLLIIAGIGNYGCMPGTCIQPQIWHHGIEVLQRSGITQATGGSHYSPDKIGTKVDGKTYISLANRFFGFVGPLLAAFPHPLDR